MAYIRVEDLYSSIEAVVFPKTLAQYEELLQAGNAVLLTGRLDVQEEKEPKLICERVEPIPDTPPAMPQTTPATEPTRSSRAGVYLRLPCNNNMYCESAYNVLVSSPGDTPVYIRFTDTNKLVKAPKEWSVTLNERLIAALKRELGDDNVAVME
jgi:DNA polymerase-3 subunit alpha